jgi:hypothetical protein
LSAELQNYGLRDGVPGTTYNKAVRAAEAIEEILLPALREALEDEDELMKQGTILGRLLQGLQDEGADIMRADNDSKAQYLCVETLMLVFVGVTSSVLPNHTRHVWRTVHSHFIHPQEPCH